ncbi:ATP-dependent DNA helicase PIF1 isoform X1 [Hyalella azteca]|uniref:ATP-dependent DNA helicase PIF1 n=1 Tax=Hyalella azteca TaxID=294128 RepID=A0A979FQZ1_HYAAZ|nr:ATP-dependent DNA helicase PIF1 isoform X1 [Hyalella azteca]
MANDENSIISDSTVLQQQSPIISCSITLDILDMNGTTKKSTTYKAVKLLLGRNQFRDLLLQCNCGSTVLKFQLQDFLLHKRFIKDGKATIDLKAEKTRIMIFNAPPNILLVFLKTLMAKKVAGSDKENKPIGLAAIRERLLSTLPNSFDEISPLTVKEYQTIRQGGTTAQQQRAANTAPFSSPLSSKRKRNSTQNDSPKSIAKRSPLVPRPPPAILLSIEQKKVLHAVKEGFNVFFTGSAGTGKSFLLKKVIGMLPPDATAVTASTGVAACHLGGTTLHSFAGIGSGEATLEQCIAQARKPAVLRNWRLCQHLVVDEISMVDGKYFQKLEAVARAVRNSDKPFGGIQLIVCGDFLQLPPVSRTNTATFSFQTSAWRSSIQRTIELTAVRRQDDQVFIDLLQEIRMGRCSETHAALLRNTAENKLSRDGILATKLCTHKEDVSHINKRHLEQLPGQTKLFTATDTEGYTKMLDIQTPVPKLLQLKVGAQVMLLKNLSVAEGLVNGSRGIVQSFAASGFPVVKFACGVRREVGEERWQVRGGGGSLHVTRRQLPLKLAWAFSIHKSQGMTLDLVEMSLSRVFEAGQAYVALSRARNLAGLRVLDFSPSCIKANPTVLKFYRALQEH